MRAVTAYEAKPDDCLAASDEAQTDLQARQRQKQRMRPGAEQERLRLMLFRENITQI